MTPEAAYANWDDLDLDERADALEEAANHALTSAGYDPVDVSYGNSASSADTDPATGDITYDPDYLVSVDGMSAFSTLYHETWHSMDVQDGVIDALPEDEREAFNDIESMNGYWDDHGEMRMETRYTVPEHDNAEAYGQAMAESVREGASQVGGGGAPPPPAGGGAGSESASDAFQIEIDWANVVITSVPSDAGSGGANAGGAAEYYEGGHAVPSP